MRIRIAPGSAVNDNTNSLLRQYLPEGADPYAFSKNELDRIAWWIDPMPPEKASLGSALQTCSCQTLSTSSNWLINLLHLVFETTAARKLHTRVTTTCLPIAPSLP
ncbi:hypothetical protein [Panacagrimonas sp.]|uniref:hypothetical protein n=1 Tax=Panacagrimonas sp. TaxID=2480088 RepID=UPI003B52B8BB